MAEKRGHFTDILKETLSTIKHDFPNATHYLVCDGHSIRLIDSSFEVNSIYCLTHLTLRLVQSILNYKDSEHEFRSAAGKKINVSEAFQKKYTTRTLLSKAFNYDLMLAKHLQDMERPNCDARIRKVLNEDIGDTEDTKIVKLMLRSMVNLYTVTQKGTIKAARTELEQLLKTSKDFVFSQIGARFTCWNGLQSLKTILKEKHQSCPLMAFTTMCDELIGQLTPMLVGGRFEGTSRSPITFERIHETVDVLCREESRQIINSYGEFKTQRVKFVKIQLK